MVRPVQDSSGRVGGSTVVDVTVCRRERGFYSKTKRADGTRRGVVVVESRGQSSCAPRAQHSPCQDRDENKKAKRKDGGGEADATRQATTSRLSTSTSLQVPVRNR